MARIRTIKPDFFTSLDVADLPVHARLTWAGLWTHMDDFGICLADARLVRAALWPLDDRTVADIEEDLRAIEAKGMICRYEVDGRQLMHAVKWDRHQRISHPAKPDLPACPHHSPESSGQAPPPKGAPPEDSGESPESSGKTPPGREGKGREGIRKGKGRAALQPEAPEDDREATPTGTAPPPTPQADTTVDQLTERWLDVIDPKRENLFQRYTTQAAVAHLLEHVDGVLVDECIGKAMAHSNDPPRSVRYLTASVRRMARDRLGTDIPKLDAVEPSWQREPAVAS